MARRNPRSGISGNRRNGSRPAKAKRKIGDTARAAERRIRELLEEQDVTGRIIQLVYDTYGPGALSEAWDAYRRPDTEDDSLAALELNAESPLLEHFTSWLAHTWRPAMLSQEVKGFAFADETPTEAFLAQHPDLDPQIAEYLHACLETPFSFFEVSSRTVGQRFTCRDLILGARHVVFDRTSSTHLRAHQVLYARIVAIGGTPLIDAAAPWPLPEDLQPAILALRELIIGHTSTNARPADARQRLLARELDLRSFYWGFVEEALKEDSLPPQLRYTSNLHKAAERLLSMLAPRKAAAGKKPENEVLRVIPEVRQQVASILTDLYENLMSEKLPLLGNKTALEAVATPDGRLKVQALIDEIEADFSLLPFSLDPHLFRRVRERLGLPPPGDGLH